MRFRSAENSSPFDRRNPRAAAIYHRLYDEVHAKAGRERASVDVLRQREVRSVVQNSYARYVTTKSRKAIQFAEAVTEITEALRKGQSKLARRPSPGDSAVRFTMSVLAVAIFGAAPGYARRENCDAYATTIRLISEMLEKFEETYNNETAFSEGVCWTLREYLERCERTYGPFSLISNFQADRTEELLEGDRFARLQNVALQFGLTFGLLTGVGVGTEYVYRYLASDPIGQSNFYAWSAWIGSVWILTWQNRRPSQSGPI